MKFLALVAVLVGSAVALPAKLDHLERTGYNYEPPAVPAGLYEVPTTTTTTTTTTTPPPPPPDAGYLPPAQPSEPKEVVVPVPTEAPAKNMMLMPYEFRYAVDDNEYGTQFHHVEDSDGEYVTGEYSVLLPDGRTQLVRFASDPENGYTAEVTYV